MKTSKSIIHLGLSALIVAGCITSCSQEGEHIAPHPPDSDKEVIQETEEIRFLSNATSIEPPESGETEVDVSNLPFPQQSSTNARTASSGVTDFVDFNDPQSLDIIAEDALNTYAAWPFYIQQVGNAWVHVAEKSDGARMISSDYGHYHLSYQYFEPEVNLQTGNLCKPTSEGCVDINPLQEHRFVTTHSHDQWIKIYAYDYTNPSRVFDLKGIFVRSGAIKIIFHKASGQWYQFSNVEPGVYNFSSITSDITKVLITSVSGGPSSFDNVKVHVPAY